MSTRGDRISMVLFGCIGAYITGCITGAAYKTDNIRNDALRAGAAEYYIDKDNNRAFRWKIPQLEKQ